MTTTQTAATDTLEALARSLWAADEFASSLAVHAGEDAPEAGAYIDLSDRRDGTYNIELGSDEEEAIVVRLSEAFLVELHAKLTTALLARRYRPAR